ncbi:hypothetical protein DT075_12800 [Bacillus licheniformis]|nr:hypothetical protein DT075_12800 [Bacillus licheniformis]
MHEYYLKPFETAATVFPQAFGLAHTWDRYLIKQIGSAVGDEVRGFHHLDPAANGVNVWAPVVDLLRDPRWGRNEEGYSQADEYEYPFQDPSLPVQKRVSDLLSRLTLEEKVSLMHQYQPAVPRLGIPAFKTGTEALHGVAWLGEVINGAAEALQEGTAVQPKEKERDVFIYF